MTTDTFTEYAQGNHSDRPDPALIPLSRTQATRLVHLALTTAANLGLDLTYEGGAALVPRTPDNLANPPIDEPDTPSRVLGLSNLARTLARYDEHRWPALIEEHFTELLQQVHQGPPPPPADPEHQLIQRLVPRDALPPDWTADRPDFLPGLLAVPATAENGIVTMFLEPSDLGLTWSDAERFGLSNLRNLTDELEYVEHDGIRLALIGGTAFAASRALVLDTVLRDSLHLEPPPPQTADPTILGHTETGIAHGVLVALPARDLLILHVIQDLTVIPALGLLINLAARSHAHDPGPLTPEVYLVTPDPASNGALTWHPATTASHDRTPLHLSPQLEALTKRLATRELPPQPT